METWEISSDSSSDTIISPPTKDLESILKRYCSGDNYNISPKSKGDDSDLKDFSDDDLVDLPLIKRIRKNSNSDPQKSASNNVIKLPTNDYSWDELKNIPGGKSTKKSTSENSVYKMYELSDSSDDLNYDPPIKVPQNIEENSEYLDDFPLFSNSQGSSKASAEKFNDNDDNLLLKLSEKYKNFGAANELNVPAISKRTKIVNEKESKKTEKEAIRLQKIKDREKKKAELEKEKQMKNALKSVEKNLKPEECLKFMTVKIDNAILQEEFGDVIIESLQSSEISYKIKSQLIPNMISWSRKVQTVENMFLNKTEVEEKNFLLLMNLRTFLQHVENKTLLSHIQTVFSIIEAQQLTIAVYGLENYHRFQKNRKNQEFRSEIACNSTKGTNKGNKDLKNLPRIPKDRIEYALAEVQLFYPTYWRPVEKFEDVAMVVLECTKAVAQIPYKLKKQEKYQQQSEYFAGMNKDCVRVDKNGNGLNRLWNQALTMFPLARLETAEAISAVYSTPQSLFEAYEACENKTDGEKLLQEIPIRRAAGLMTSVRRIGPELSKKAQNFFFSTNNILL